MLQSHLRGEAFRVNPNVPPTPSMDLDAFLMWGSKLILFAKNMCLCNMVTGWICRSNGCDCKMLSCQRQWLFMADRGHGACTMNINHSIMSSKHLQHMKSQLTREDHSSLIQDDPRLKFFICFDPGIQSTSFVWNSVVGNQAHRSSPVACEVSYLRNPLDEGRQVRVKKQLAVISWFGIHETMKNTWSQEMLRIFQRQNVSFPLSACCDTDIIWVHQQIRLNTLHQESWI